MRFLIASPPPGERPDAQFVHETARLLRARGHKVLLVYFNRPPTPAEEPWYREADLQWVYWRREGSSLRRLLALKRIIAQFRPDMVEFHFSATTPGLIAARLAGVRCRIAWYQSSIVFGRSIYPGSRLALWAHLSLERLARRTATHHVTLSSSSRDEYIREYGIPARRVTVQPLGIEITSAGEEGSGFRVQGERFGARDSGGGEPSAERGGGISEPQAQCGGWLFERQPRHSRGRNAAPFRALLAGRDGYQSPKRSAGDGASARGAPSAEQDDDDAIATGNTARQTGERGLLVCLSRLCRMKGQEILIHCLPELVGAFPRLILAFAGPGDPTPLRELATRLGVADHCEFRGDLPRQEALRILQHADVALFPSQAEAFGLVTLEAMACGTPLIATAVGAAADIIENGTTGVLLPVGKDPGPWRVAIAGLLRNPEQRARIAAAARSKVREYALAERVAAYADWLESVSCTQHHI